MNVYTSSELASKTKAVCDAARSEGCAFITTNGKTDLMLVCIADFPTINEAVHSYDSWRAHNALRRMWAHTDGISLDDGNIQREIEAMRAESDKRGSRS